MERAKGLPLVPNIRLAPGKEGEPRNLAVPSPAASKVLNYEEQLNATRLIRRARVQENRLGPESLELSSPASSRYL